MDVSGFSPPQSSVTGANTSLPPPPQEVSLFTLPSTPVDSSTLNRGKIVKKERAKPLSTDSNEGDDTLHLAATPTPVTPVTPGRAPGSVKPLKKVPRPVAVVESLFKRGSEAELNPAESIDQLMEQKEPRTIKISDGDGFRAQLMVPCEFVLLEERKRSIEEWGDAELKRVEKRNSNQTKLAALSDWQFRRKTPPCHCTQKRFTSIQELLDYTDNGGYEDIKSLMADLAYEKEGVSPDSDPNNPLWKLASYPFQLSDMQMDMLIVLAGIPEYSPEAGLITEDEARDNMVTFMEGLLSRPDPRTGKVDWYFRALPMQFLLNAILIDWAITAIHPVYMDTMLQEPTTPNLCFLAYLVFLQRAPLKGAIVEEPTREWPPEPLYIVEEKRRNIPPNLVKRELVKKGVPTFAECAAASSELKSLRNGQVGKHYNTKVDLSYYWLHAEHTSTRMMAHLMRVRTQEAPLSRIDILLRAHHLIEAASDRSQGRYECTGRNQVHMLKTNTSVGTQLERSLEMVNLLIAPDPKISPLDVVLDQWNSENVKRTPPQPIKSTLWAESLNGMGEFFNRLVCLTCMDTCKEETCLGVKAELSRPQNAPTLFKRILMSTARDQELYEWRSATTELPPQVSYGLCSFFASPQSLTNWAHERHTVFLGVETWQAHLADAAKLPELALEINSDEFDTRHAKVALISFVNGEFDIPVSMAVVDDSGRAIVDLHTVPSTACEPAINPRHQRLPMSQLHSKVVLLPFTGYGFSFAPQESL